MAAAVLGHSSFTMNSWAQARGSKTGGFQEAAVARGISFIASEPSVYGHGAAFCDLDDDGDADLVCAGATGGRVGVFENDGTGHFIDRSDTSGIPFLPGTQGIISADYDRDGKLDLYLSRAGEPNVLLRNCGDMCFEVAENSGVETTGMSHGCAWTDFDRDGWIDLAVSVYIDGTDHLYRNMGDGTFSDVTEDADFNAGPSNTFQLAFFDMDGDGDADAYRASDARGVSCDALGFRNALWENLGDRFKNISNGSGADVCLDSMCIAIGDFSGNGYQDLFITNNPGGHALLANNGDGTFEDVAPAAGVDDTESTGWGSVFFDHNNDGLLDLYMCRFLEPNALFEGGTWPVDDVAQAAGVDVPGLSFAVAAADIDLDGDMDFLVQNLFENIRLFINEHDSDNHWARFDIVGHGDSRHAIGATLRIHASETLQVREVIAGSNFKSQNELVQHVGLGGAQIIDSVKDHLARRHEANTAQRAGGSNMDRVPAA